MPQNTIEMRLKDKYLTKRAHYPLLDPKPCMIVLEGLGHWSVLLVSGLVSERTAHGPRHHRIVVELLGGAGTGWSD